MSTCISYQLACFYMTRLLEVERQFSSHILASDLYIAFVVENNKCQCVVASYISVVLSFGCSLSTICLDLYDVCRHWRLM